MPLFYTPKPRQFHYRPRFYDLEKERWEALKQKYADEKAAVESRTSNSSQSQSLLGGVDDELEYFERRVRELDRQERSREHELTWKDFFRKREMPKFNYQPRFSGANGDDQTQALNQSVTSTPVYSNNKSHKKIRRRYDISDVDYMKPVPAGRIMLYVLLVCLLLYWVLF